MTKKEAAACARKKPYHHRRQARKAAKRMASARRCEIRIYKCGVCGHLHLTSITAEAQGLKLVNRWPA